MKNVILFGAVALVMALAGSVFGQTPVTVSDFNALRAAVTGGEAIVEVTGDIGVTSPIVVPTGSDVMIRSDGSAYALTLTGSAGGSMFVVSEGAILKIVGRLTLAGKSGNNAPVVTVNSNGTFDMNGVTITGNTSSGLTGAARAGGVGLDVNAVFYMRGGSIVGNTYTGSGGAGSGAGGVLVNDGATFYLSGGEVSNNVNSFMSTGTGGLSNGSAGVYVTNGTLYMYGGTISQNRQIGNYGFAAAGGVYLALNSELYMYGGTITDNSAVSPPSGSSSGGGDGVYVNATSTVHFKGSPVIDDGLYVHVTGSNTLAPRIIIDGDGLNDGALITVQGCTREDQMGAGVNITSPFDGLTSDMAKAFVSKDKTLVGKLGGTASNPRIVWADNFDLAIAPEGSKVFDPAVYGYGEQTPYSVTIRNTGKGQTNALEIILSGTGAGAFSLSKEKIGNIAAGATDNFTVSPNTGLSVGTYSAMVTVLGEYDISVIFGVSFTVTQAIGAGTVEMAGWTYGGIPNSPSVSGTPSDSIRYFYKAQGAGDDTYSATKPTNAGSYTVKAVASASHNYTGYEATAGFIIEKTMLTVTATDHYILFNAPIPAYGVYYQGFVNNENALALGGILSFSCTYIQGSNVGEYPITPSGLTSDNYSIDFKPGMLHVSQNPTGCAGSVSITGWTYGAAPNSPMSSSTNGTGTYTYVGIGATVYGPAAEPPTDVGTYKILADFPETNDLAACSAENNFDITPARLRVVTLGTNIFYGDPVPDYSSSVFATGLVHGDKQSDLDDKLDIECTYDQGSDAGEYVIKTKFKDGESLNNYNVEFLEGILTVQRAPAGINVTVGDKEYDGTASALVDSAVVPARYRYAGDTKDSVYVVPGTAEFADKNAGANKSVVLNGWALGGPKAYNYSLLSVRSARLASIIPRPIAVRPDDIAYAGKVYDGTTAVNKNDLSIMLTNASGIIDGDDVTAGFASAEFDDKNAGADRVVTVSGITLGGQDAGNYTLLNAAAVKDAEITKSALVLRADDKHMKIGHEVPAYTYTLTGLVGGDSASVITTEPQFTLPANFDQQTAGTYDIVPSGAVAANYVIAYKDGELWVVDRDDISADIVFEDGDAVYDGTPRPHESAVYNGSGANFTYSYTGVATNGEIYGSSAIPPTDAGSYTVTARYWYDEDAEVEHIGAKTASFVIKPKPVTISVTLENGGGKVYDGTTAAKVESFEVVGKVGADDVSAVEGIASFVDKNTGDDKKIIFDGWSLTGAKSYNYVLDGQPDDAQADIDTLEITISSDDVFYGGKVYDGTREVSRSDLNVIVLSAASGLVPGDGAAASFTLAEFDDPNVGTTHTVTISGMTLRGPNADNYKLSSTSVVKNNVEISPRDLIIRVNDTIITVGGALPTFTTSAVSGLVDGEAWPTVAALNPDDDQTSFILPPDFDVSKAGTYTVTIKDGSASASNYNIICQSGTLTVSDKNVVGDGSVIIGGKDGDDIDYVGKIIKAKYDGEPRYITVGGSPVISDLSDNIIITYAGKTVAGEDYGPTNIPPTDAGSYTVDIFGEDANNIYKSRWTLIISPRDVTIAGAEHTKVYDGTKNVSGIIVTLTHGGANGIVGKDINGVSVGEVAAMYKETYVGADSITITSVKLDGARASNYVVVVPKTVRVEGITAKPITAYVSMEGWVYGSVAKSPVVNGIPADYDTSRITITYTGVTNGGEEYGSSVHQPTLAGDYVVRVDFDTVGGYGKYIASAGFTIARAPQNLPYISGLYGLARQGLPLGAPDSVAGLTGATPRIPFDLSGLKFEVSNDSIKFVTVTNTNLPWSGFAPDTLDMANWEYKRLGADEWKGDPLFTGLAPNTEYVILVRMKGNDNFLPSDSVAVLVRTSVEGTVEEGAGEIVVVPLPPTIHVTPPASDKPQGILLKSTVVTDKAEFMVAVSENASVNVAIYDKMGNVVFRRSGAKSYEDIVWDIKGASRRGVSGGTYLIVASARDRFGKAYKYSAKLNVRGR